MSLKEAIQCVRDSVEAGSVFILFILFLERGCGSFSTKYHVNAKVEFGFSLLKSQHFLEYQLLVCS